MNRTMPLVIALLALVVAMQDCSHRKTFKRLEKANDQATQALEGWKQDQDSLKKCLDMLERLNDAVDSRKR